MFTQLFTPIAWRGRTARNRIVRLPTTSNLAEKSMVSDAMVENYRRIARGGVGTIVTEGMAIHPVSLRGERSIAAFAEASVPGLARLAEATYPGTEPDQALSKMGKEQLRDDIEQHTGEYVGFVATKIGRLKQRLRQEL